MQRTINSLLFGWLACYSALCWANNTLAQDLIAYDWMSLAFAAAAGLLGGAARTIFTLVSERALVGNVRTLLLKDLVVALLGGAAMYLVIQGYNSGVSLIQIVTLPPIARDLRVLLIVGAGFSRGRWFGVLDRLASDAITNASSKLRGGSLPHSPSSVAAPQPEE